MLGKNKIMFSVAVDIELHNLIDKLSKKENRSKSNLVYDFLLNHIGELKDRLQGAQSIAIPGNFQKPLKKTGAGGDTNE